MPELPSGADILRRQTAAQTKLRVSEKRLLIGNWHHPNRQRHHFWRLYQRSTCGALRRVHYLI